MKQVRAVFSERPGDLSLSHPTRLILSLAGWGVYVLFFLLLYFLFGRGANALAVVPVMITGWLLGLRAGLVTGLLAYPLNVLLFYLLDYPGLSSLIHYRALPAVVALALIGLIVGRLRDLEHDLRRELAERRRAEAALQRSEARLRQIIDLVPHPIFVKDLEGRFLLVNEAAAQFNGTTVEKITGSLQSNWVKDRRALQRMLRDDREVIVSGRPKFIAEDYLTDERGRRHVMQVSKIPFDLFEANSSAILGLLVDVTERKRAEEALSGARDNLERRNRQLAQILEIGNKLRITLEPEALYQEIVGAAQRSLGFATVILNMLDENEQVHVRAYAGLDEEGEQLLAHAVYPLTDFTRLMEEQFRVENCYFVPQGIFDWQQDFVGPTYISPRYQQAYPSDSQAGGWQSDDMLLIPVALSQGQVTGFLSVDRPLDGRRPDQETLQVLSIFANHAAVAIENVRLYEQLKQDARTKAVLLDEVNHRVKNNLAAIIGLIYIEGSRLEEESLDAYQDIMGNLISRIRGLAMAHRLLSAVGWSPLLLSDLAAQVIRSALQSVPVDKQVVLEVTSSKVKVIHKQANSLALVINELAANVTKHALGKSQGICTISVSIELEEDGKVMFEFRDNGPGYSENVLKRVMAQESQSGGLYLIQSIVAIELRGSVTFDNNHGAVVTICFKLGPGAD